MKGLLEAPDDVQLKILEFSDPRDIRTFQLVCRTFHDLIVTSPQIQYILALDVLGYAMPCVPRSDLTPRQKVEFLERHRRNWSHPDTCQPTKYMLPLHENGGCGFNGGVYARTLHGEFTSRKRRIVGIRFYQLPSPNLGLEFKEWHIPDFGLIAQGLAFDTAQDLLVLIELGEHSRSWSEGCRIHLRTMSDNSQHPKAVVPLLLAEFTESEGDLENTLPFPMMFEIEVVSKSLAILFISRTQNTTSWVIVWDWHRGEELTRISTSDRQGTSSFTLLSQDRLLLPRHSKSYYVQEDVPDNTCGSLDIYIFDLNVSTSTPPRMIASFGLPKLDEKSCISSLRIDGGHPCIPPSACADTRPKVYDPAVQDRLITVTAWLRTTPSATSISQHVLLYIPQSLLLRSQTPFQGLDDAQVIAEGNDDVTIAPWDTWAPFICWRGDDDSRTGASYLYGQRAAMVANLPDTEYDLPSDDSPPELFLFDFNQRRVRWAKSGEKGTTREPCIVPEGVVSTNPSRGGRGSSGRGRTRGRGRGGSPDIPPRLLLAYEAENRLRKPFREAQLGYARQAWRLPYGPGYTFYPDLRMDDEHVVVLKRERDLDYEEGEISLLVYTFGEETKRPPNKAAPK